MPGPGRDPTKWRTLICKRCGQPFEARTSVARLYCSMQCRSRDLADRTRGRDPTKWGRTTCPTCETEFDYLLTWPRKYCSNVCAGKANIGNIPGFTPTAYAAVCESCGESFNVLPSMTRGRFCSSRCWGRWQSIHIRGATHPVTGRKFGRTKRWGPPQFKDCAVCGTAFGIKPSEAALRRCCSKACYGKWMSENVRGPAHPTWRGGYLPYYGPSWPTARRAARARDGQCQDCGATAARLGRELDVHHLLAFRLFGVARHDDANHLDNLVSLCNACHTRREALVTSPAP